MDVVRGRETPAARQRVAEPRTLVHGRRDGEPEERQPRERRQHVQPHEYRHGQEHDDAHDKRSHERIAFQRLGRREHDRADVRRGQKRRPAQRTNICAVSDSPAETCVIAAIGNPRTSEGQKRWP